MKVKNAIIILGPGKSGTTLVNNIFAFHPELFWISSYVHRFPNLPVLSILNNIQSIDAIERLTRNLKNFPRPAEAFWFWHHYIPFFHKTQNHFSKEEIETTQRVIHKIGNLQKGNRFFTKLTGPARFDFLNAMFEDPYIIWINRDAKSVITSYYNKRWKYKEDTSKFENKTKYELIKEYCEYYQWLDSQKEKLRGFNFLEVNYESLVNDPESFFKDLCVFSNLDYPKTFQKKIRSWDITKSTNEKYKQIFNDEELKYLQALLSPKH